MIYLTLGPSIAACETERAAQRRELHGYTRVSEAAFVTAWRAKSTAQLRAMYPEPVARAVGENVVYPTEPWWDKGTKR